jgi:hypothetical protein
MKMFRLIFLLLAFGFSYHPGAQTVGPVITSGLFEPYGVAVDKNNAYYVADSANQRIAKYQPNFGVLESLAGGEKMVGNIDGPGFFARFNSPRGLVYDPNREALVVADSGNNLLRLVTLPLNPTSRVAVVTTLAGSLTAGSNDGQGTNAQFNFPVGLTIDSSGLIYIVDSKNKSVRTLDANATVSTLIDGRNFFVRPSAIAIDGQEQFLLLTDSGKNAIWRIGLVGADRGTLSLFAGSSYGLSGSKDDYFSTNALFNAPNGISYIRNFGFLVCDSGNHVLRKLYRDIDLSSYFHSEIWSVETYAGAAGQPGFEDGALKDARFNFPVAATTNQDNATLVVDSINNALRQIQINPPTEKSIKPIVGWISLFHDPLNPLATERLTSFTEIRDNTIVFNNKEDYISFHEYNGEIFFWRVPFNVAMGNDVCQSPPQIYIDRISTNGTYRQYMTEGELPIPIVEVDGVTKSGQVYGPHFFLIYQGKESGKNASDLECRECKYEVARPTIIKDNPFYPQLNCATREALLYWTTNGVSFPETITGGVNTNIIRGPVVPGERIRLDFDSSVTLTVKGYRDGFVSSELSDSVSLSASNFVANRISFGFEHGEASAQFVAGPGQSYFAPVGLTLLPSQTIYTMQFGLVSTNFRSSGIQPWPLGFHSTLVRPKPYGAGVVYQQIPPMAYVYWPGRDPLLDFPVGWEQQFKYANPDVFIHSMEGVWPATFVPMFVTNQANGLIMLGWFEGYGESHLYETLLHHLVAYSLPRNRLWKAEQGRAVVGGFALGIPRSARTDDQIQIAIIRPSATSDGVDEDVFIFPPTDGDMGAGKINARKQITIANPGYVVGDVEPFRWFNAGEFGESDQPTIINNDVLQVFLCASSIIYDGFGDPTLSGYGDHRNRPPMTSDLYDAMDSSDSANAVNTKRILIPAPADGSDSDYINQMFFGDGQIDITDMYVTFRRSLDPTLKWFYRYHTTNGLAVKEVPNTFRGKSGYPGTFPDLPAEETSNGQPVLPAEALSVIGSTNDPAITFIASDIQGAPGQTVSVPIRAAISGPLPARMLMLSLQVDPVAGSPEVSKQVAFVPSSGLGPAFSTNAPMPAAWSGAWLNPISRGLWGDTLVGQLVVTIPTNATSESAYRVQFDHASATPTGIGLFPRQILHGLITLKDRSQSSWHDQIPDTWRLRYFGTISNLLSHAQADADGDGVPNWAEFKAGTNPVDIESKLHVWLSQRHNLDVSPVNAQDGAVQLRWPSVLGKTYLVESSPSVGVSAQWIILASELQGTGGELQFTDVHPEGPRFYRVRVVE